MFRVRHAVSILTLAAFAACSSGGGTEPPPPGNECPDPTPLAVETPPGFPNFDSVVPQDNPMTVEGVALGRRLFYDPVLSGDSTQACASCHQQATNFGDPRRFSVGIDGIEGTRQAPSLANAAWLPAAFWDGRAASLEAQALEPVPNEIEMHLEWDDAVARLSASDVYPDLFCAAFGDKTITEERVVMAIAQFERTFISFNSRYDRYKRGEVALTPAEEAGRALYNTELGDCFHCHGGILRTDMSFRNIGLDSVIVDEGRYEVTGVPSDRGKFKVPSLRNVMVSAPYMHDGRFATIKDVLQHYNGGFHDQLGVDPLIRARGTLREGQLDTLIIFLETFTDSTFINNPDLSNPFEQ